MTASLCVRNDDCVRNHVLGPDPVWFLWLLRTRNGDSGAVTDCPVAKRRRVLSLCGGESGYTGRKGTGFL